VDDKDLALIVEDLDDLTIKGINTRRAKSGRQPSRQTSQFTSSKGKGGKGKTGGDKSAVKCSYCNKERHCYTQINKNAPCVDNTGNTVKLATVDEQDAEIDSSLVRHLNGFVWSVKDQEDQIDLSFACGPGAPPTGSPHTSCHSINDMSILYKGSIKSTIQKLSS
jgi:hypothetical protein